MEGVSLYYPSLSLKIVAMNFQHQHCRVELQPITHLCHHASPRNEVHLNLLSSPLFMVNNSLQQAIKMIVACVIQFLKGIKPSR